MHKVEHGHCGALNQYTPGKPSAHEDHDHHPPHLPGTWRGEASRALDPLSTGRPTTPPNSASNSSAGAHAAGGLPFTILSFSDGSNADSVVFLESRGDGFYLESEAEINRHRLVFSRTQGSALSVPDSATFLEDLLT